MSTIPAWRDNTPTGYRWNPDLKRVEFWGSRDLWMESAFKSVSDSRMHGTTAVSFSKTWAEPIE